MWPNRVANPRPMALESDALPTALRGPAVCNHKKALGLRCLVHLKTLGFR